MDGPGAIQPCLPWCRQVAWIHLARQMILTIHDKVITSTPRIRLVQDDPHTWVLHISQVQPTDGGLYMCQVNTVPLMSQVGTLKVNGERLQRGRPVLVFYDFWDVTFGQFKKVTCMYYVRK